MWIYMNAQKSIGLLKIKISTFRRMPGKLKDKSILAACSKSVNTGDGF